MRLKRHYEMDMTQGALLPQVLRFTIPLVLSGMLQLLYNAADVVVVGRFASAQALAAVSCVAAVIILVVKHFRPGKAQLLVEQVAQQEENAE